MKRILAVAVPISARFWNSDTFSSLSIMGIRVGMLAAKFILSIFIARYMGLEALGIYGLIVGAAGIIQTVLRGGVFTFISRDAVKQPIGEITHHLRHYGTGMVFLYLLLVPVALAAGWHFDDPVLAMLILGVFFTEHISFDVFVIINNLQYSRLANVVFSLQSGAWIYPFVLFAFLYPSLRSLEAVLAFWVGGGLIALAITAWLARGWPWKEAFSRKLELIWYSDKIKKSFKLYLADVLGVVNYYMDRYIVTLFLSLEMTGIYVFFSQVVTATWNLVNSGVLIVYNARLIRAYDRNNPGPFNEQFRECMTRAGLSTIALSIFAGVAVPVLVRFTDNEALVSHIPLLWIMLIAVFFKVGETAAGTCLFAMHRDRDAFIIGLIGLFITAIIGSAGVIFFGVYGIVFNMVIVCTSGMLYTRSVWIKTSSDRNGETQHV